MVRGRVDKLLGVGARRDVGQRGDDRLAKVPLAARKETVQGGLVQVRKAQRNEEVHRLFSGGHVVDVVHEAEGLLALVLVELARPWKDKFFDRIY